MALNLLRDCKDIKGEEEKKEGCVKHRERSSEVHFLGNDSNL
ncbi:transposase, partial [Escherichia coli]